MGIVYGDFVDFSAPDLSDALYVNVRQFDASTTGLTRKYFLFDGPIVPSTTLIRRAVFEDVGLFDESFKAYEETEFFLRASERWRFQHMPGRLTFKRRHGNNITRRLDALLPYAERITREWSEKRPELAAVAGKRRARYYASAGNDCLAKKATGEGFRLLGAALRESPASWRIYAYLVIGAVPTKLQAGVRRGFKSVFHALASRIRSKG